MSQRYTEMVDFNDVSGALDDRYWADWFYELGRQNLIRIESSDANLYDFLQQSSVELIFTICARCRLPDTVRYRAIFIFAKFMSIQTVQLHKFLESFEEGKRNSSWVDCQLQIQRHLQLRIVSSIQIASKAEDFHTSLSSDCVVGVLKRLGENYTQRAVLQSEMRILKTVGYAMPATPVDYANSLLKCFHADWFYYFHHYMHVEHCWDHVLLFLDVIYINLEEFYAYVISEGLKHVPYLDITNRIQLTRLKNDYLMLCSGVVAAALCTVHHWSIIYTVCDALARIGGTPPMDIYVFALGAAHMPWYLKRSETTKHST